MRNISNVIILNGPPNSGKDKSADYVVAKYGYTKLEMKGALRRLAHKIASIAVPSTFDAIHFYESIEFDKELKDNLIVSEFGGRTWREFLIFLSEEVCKPIFGDDIFSLAAYKAIMDSNSERIIFSDGGFQVEYDSLLRMLPKTKITLVHVHKEGCMFKSSKIKDSRGYISPAPGQPFFNLHNIDGDFVNSHRELDRILRVVDPYCLFGIDNGEG